MGDEEAGDGKAKGLRQTSADPYELLCKWVIAASVFGLLLLLTVLVTEVQENVEVDGVAHAKDVMRTQFINQHESHLADPKINSLMAEVHNLTDALNDGSTKYQWPAPPEPAIPPPLPYFKVERPLNEVMRGRVIMPERVGPPPAPPVGMDGSTYVYDEGHGRMVAQSQMFPLTRDVWQPIDNEKRRVVEREMAMRFPPAHPPALPGYPPLLRNYEHFMRPLNGQHMEQFLHHMGSDNICFHSAGSSIPDAKMQFPFMDPKVLEPLRCCGNVYSFYQSNKQKLGVGCHLFEGAGCHGGNGGGRYGTEWHRRMTTFKGGQVRANMLGSCAVVGNDAILVEKERGQEIDAHDTVIRIGHFKDKTLLNPVTPDILGFEESVGRKTSITWLNGKTHMAGGTADALRAHDLGRKRLVDAYLVTDMSEQLAGMQKIADTPYMALNPKATIANLAMAATVGGGGAPSEAFKAAVFFATSGLCSSVSVFGFGGVEPRAAYWVGGPTAGAAVSETRALHAMMRDSLLCVYM